MLSAGSQLAFSVLLSVRGSMVTVGRNNSGCQ
jgi:hypothetical protein